MKFFIGIFFLILPFLSHTKTIDVCGTCEVKTLKEAIELAENGDTILIKEGTYKEQDIHIIDKAIHIKGEGNPVIDGENKGTVNSVRANNFTI